MHPDGPPGRCAPAEATSNESTPPWPTSRSGCSAAKYAYFCIRNSESGCEGLRGRSRPRSR
eukprot:6098449-Prymnesium_polylepis.1